MTDLTITLTGEVRESNFDEWKDGLVERIRAVDVELSADDDFRSANDSVRQFREAEQTLKAAKQAALEQAADINRLFDAVDAVTEETRQARLALERRIRLRRHELKRQSLQAHMDNNAATLDALPVAQRALFQDRATLLGLSAEELDATIEERLAVWRALERGVDPADAAARADGPATSPDAGSEVASDIASDVGGAAGGSVHGAGEGVARVAGVDGGEAPASVDASTDAGNGAGADPDAPRAWRVTIDLSAPKAKADQLYTRVRDRWKADKAVKGIELSGGD